jgi:hypothetical protein
VSDKNVIDADVDANEIRETTEKILSLIENQHDERTLRIILSILVLGFLDNCKGGSSDENIEQFTKEMKLIRDQSNRSR